MRRPQHPDIFRGLSGKPWSLAILIDTGASSLRKAPQQSCLPQRP
jgi:hypothetical protein